MGCLKRMVGLVLLLLVIGGLFLFRGHLREAWRSVRGGGADDTVPSEELAAAAGAKLDALRDGTRTYAALSGVELQSLLLYRYQGVIPAFLESPQIELAGDQLRLRGRVPIDKLPSIDALGEVASFLPDTTDLLIEGRLLPLNGGRAAFAVDRVSAARFPLPGSLVPRALAELGRRDEPGLPRDAMALPLPPGVVGAYIRRDSLVLITRGDGAN
ncbi:MAG TPA: hypothetical protein VMN60_01225 [Longimicrobiales bacterium]|nr:hypothetical protein [Longimicrobiales bacterium]